VKGPERFGALRVDRCQRTRIVIEQAALRRAFNIYDTRYAVEQELLGILVANKHCSESKQLIMNNRSLERKVVCHSAPFLHIKIVAKHVACKDSKA
jgi:hypothetical protein